MKRSSAGNGLPIIKRLGLWSAFPALVLAILTFALDAGLSPNLLSTGGLVGYSTSAIPIIAAALGQAVLLIGRGLDLGMGATMSLVNVVTVTLFSHGYSGWIAIPAGLAVAMAVGAGNAVLIVVLRINALLATFGVSFVTGGVALWLMPAPGGSIPPGLVNFIMSSIVGVPVGIIVLILFCGLWLMLNRSVFMLQLYAVGGDPAKAFSSGIPLGWIRAGSYLVSAVFVGLAGLGLTLSIGSGDPLIGQTYTLLSVAAAVVGGVAIFGGSGDGLGAVFGAIFLGTISDLLLGLGVSSFYQQFIVGIIILLGLAGVVVLQTRLARLRRRDARAVRRQIREHAT